MRNSIFKYRQRERMGGKSKMCLSIFEIELDHRLYFQFKNKSFFPCLLQSSSNHI